MVQTLELTERKDQIIVLCHNISCRPRHRVLQFSVCPTRTISHECWLLMSERDAIVQRISKKSKNVGSTQLWWWWVDVLNFLTSTWILWFLTTCFLAWRRPGLWDWVLQPATRGRPRCGSYPSIPKSFIIRLLQSSASCDWTDMDEEKHQVLMLV